MFSHVHRCARALRHRVWHGHTQRQAIALQTSGHSNGGTCEHVNRNVNSHSHSCTVNTRTPWHCCFPPAQLCLPVAGGIRTGQEKPALPTQQDSSYVPPHWTPHPQLAPWKFPEFPRGPANQNRLRPPNPVAPRHTLHTSSQCSPIIHGQAAACSVPRNPVLIHPRPLQPSLEMGSSGLGASGKLCSGPVSLQMFLNIFHTNGVRLGRPGKWQAESWKLTWG